LSIYWLFALSLLFSALFSGTEIAFLTANRLRLELDKKQNPLLARLLSIYTSNPALFIASILVGNNVALVLYGLAISEILNPYLGGFFSDPWLLLLLQTLLSTILLLLFAEFLPKAICRIHANGLLKVLAFPIFVFYILFYPVSKLMTLLSGHLVRLFTKRNLLTTPQPTIFGRNDLNVLIEEAAQQSEEEDEHDPDPSRNALRLMRNALEFSEAKVRDCYVPRPDIVMIDVNDSLEELRALFISSNFSRIPVYENTVDNIIGYVNAKSLFRHPDSIRQILISLRFIPETMSASRLLSDFIHSSSSMAIVVDEFGGTAGLVTIEDLVEEIFGEINDEHDRLDIQMSEVGEGVYHLSGRAEVEEVNERFGLKIPESDDYDTVAGYILAHHPSIPVEGATCVIEDYTFRILKVEGSRITLVELTL
jgi:Hemolysins and related proteins containing CBS domains